MTAAPHVTDMGGFIDGGAGSPEGDRWLEAMTRLCMLIDAWQALGHGRQHGRPAADVDVSSRGGRERLASHTLPDLMDGLFGGILSEINGVIRSRILTTSSGTDHAVAGGAFIDFARTADRGLLARLADICNPVIRRFEDGKDGGGTRSPSCDYMSYMSQRHLILPVILCRGDWTAPGRFMSECATGYMPVTVACPSATDHGYEGPDAGDAWLRLLARPDEDLISYVPWYERMTGAYDPLSFAGCSLSSAYEEGYGLHLYLILMSGMLPVQGGFAGTPPLWMVPMTARSVTTMKARYDEAMHDPMRIMGGFRLDDVIHAVSGQLRPSETEWLLCDVDWDWRPPADQVMSVLTGMEDSLDPGSWHRISWAPLAAALDAGDPHAAVTAMRAFRLAFTGVFPRTMISMQGDDGGKTLALAATVPDPSSFHTVADMLLGNLPGGFVKEDLDATGRIVLLTLPHIQGDFTIAADSCDCTYFRIPEEPLPDDGSCPERLRALLEGGGVTVRWAAPLGS